MSNESTQLNVTGEPLKTAARGSDWPSIKQEAIENREPICAECGKQKPEDGLEVHHITPVSEGGSDDLDNLELLCDRCHNYEHRNSVRDDEKIPPIEITDDSLSPVDEDILRCLSVQNEYLRDLHSHIGSSYQYVSNRARVLDAEGLIWRNDGEYGLTDDGRSIVDSNKEATKHTQEVQKLQEKITELEKENKELREKLQESSSAVEYRRKFVHSLRENTDMSQREIGSIVGVSSSCVHKDLQRNPGDVPVVSGGKSNPKNGPTLAERVSELEEQVAEIQAGNEDE